jgi:hypothetical protein
MRSPAASCRTPCATAGGGGQRDAFGNGSIHRPAGPHPRRTQPCARHRLPAASCTAAGSRRLVPRGAGAIAVVASLGTTTARWVSRSPRSPSPGEARSAALGLSLHDQRSCGIEANGDVWCWGSNTSGCTRRWHDDRPPRRRPKSSACRHQSSSSADSSSPARSPMRVPRGAGELNFFGQVGDGTTTESLPPDAREWWPHLHRHHGRVQLRLWGAQRWRGALLGQQWRRPARRRHDTGPVRCRLPSPHQPW